jgi:hypothetical protein
VADRLAYEVGEVVVGDFAGDSRLLGFLELAPDRGRVPQFPLGLIVGDRCQLDEAAQRQDRQAQKQGQYVHLAPAAGVVAAKS